MNLRLVCFQGKLRLDTKVISGKIYSVHVERELQPSAMIEGVQRGTKLCFSCPLGQKIVCHHRGGVSVTVSEEKDR